MLLGAVDSHAGFAQSGEVAGLDRIQADIVADAPNKFVHVMGLEWPLSYQGAGNVSLKVNPSTAFQVSASTAGPNIFNVKLISTAGLTTPFGAVVPLSVEVFGRGGGGGQASDDIGVQFVADNGAPIDLDALSRDSSVSEFAITASPAEHVEQVRLQGSQVYYKRKPGFGAEAVTIRLSFKYLGIPYSYTADLPIKDDGMVAGTWNYQALDPVSLPDYGLSSQNYHDVVDAWDAADRYHDYIESKLLEACSREVELGYDEFDRCEEVALRKGYKKGEFQVVKANRQACADYDIVDFDVPESVCSYSPVRYNGYCFKDRLPQRVEDYVINNRIYCSINYVKRKP